MNNKLGTGILIILLSLLFGCKSGVMAQIIKNDELKPMQNTSKMNFDENIVMFDLTNRKVKLNSGYYMPTNGLGTWSLYGDTAYNSVYNALKAGVRLIDTAQYYGNEEEVDKALKKAIDEKIVKREDVFITTKVMPSNYIAIPGSSNEAHIIENNNIYDFVLSDEDMKKIICINKNQRHANW